MAIILATMFLPGLVLGVASCWHKNMLNTIVAHPSVVLMPTFTHFTFKSNKSTTRTTTLETTTTTRKSTTTTTIESTITTRESTTTTTRELGEPFITFSPKFTLVNIILSIAGNIVYGISMTVIDGWNNVYKGIPPYLYHYIYSPDVPDFFPFILIPILGLLFTLSSLLFISNGPNTHSAIIKYTLGNVVFNTAAYLVFCFTLDVSDGVPFNLRLSSSIPKSPSQIYFLPVPILSILLTLLKILPTRFCNFTFPTCFSLPSVEYGALVCSDPQAHYVLDNEGKPEHVLEDEEEKVDNQDEVLEIVIDPVASQEEETVEVLLDHAEEKHQEIEVQEA